MRLGAVAVLACAVANPAFAQVENSPAFSVERFMPTPGQTGLLGTDEADTLGHLAVAVAAVGSLMSRPLVLERLTGDGGTVITPVRVRFGLQVSAAVGLGDRVQVGVALPLVLGQSGDRLAGIGFDETDLEAFAVGDVRAHAKIRLFGGRERAGLRGGVGTSLSVPTGNQNHFAGEAGEVFELEAIAGYRGTAWRVGANLGARWRNRAVVLFTPSRPHGNEWVASVAAARRLDRIDVMAEWTRVLGTCQSELAGGGGCAIEGHSPGEVRVGGSIRVGREWTALAGVGIGTTPQDVGSPRWRVFAGATWTGERPPR